MRKLINNFIENIGVDFKGDTYRGTLKEILIDDLKERQKEIALIVSILQENDNNSFFSSFDKNYKIAKKFVELNDINKDWEEADFEEAVVEFGKRYNR